MPGHGGNRTYDLWNTSPEHWASIPKVIGSIPTVARHIFQACPVWIYTQSNITSILCFYSMYNWTNIFVLEMRRKNEYTMPAFILTININ